MAYFCEYDVRKHGKTEKHENSQKGAGTVQINTCMKVSDLFLKEKKKECGVTKAEVLFTINFIALRMIDP
jgi:hypothetical protein